LVSTKGNQVCGKRLLDLADLVGEFHGTDSMHASAWTNEEEAAVTVAGSVELEGGLVDRREEAGLLDERHRGRVLGEEHVGGRRGALRHELVRQLAVTAVAQHDVDARVLRERLRPLLGELLVLRVVDHQRVTRCGAAPPGGAAREQERRDGERNEGSTKQVAHRWDPHDE